ncbi:uncharacterized protein LOC125750211 [Brienomyrus brachyistius]|uniref:uncharacterized protein LOC125750211 n=1 Tax=Brienomyrus brachyistius TaxID=42636 RepID=UPI0020B3E249|nr:uncharacterized protein LOC125750211 [Brienomyrus brachyistius]
MMFKLFGLLIFIDTSLAVDVVQPNHLMKVQHGDSVTLTCFRPEDISFAVWFKQAAGQKPQLMAKALRYVPGEFYEEYKNITRYSLQNAEGSFNLTISNAEPSDSAVYYCAAVFYNEIAFGNGTFVIITGKDSNSRTVVQQPVSDTVQPGDSVSLQCTIETGSCAGEHSVYWFRHGSGESLPGVIYSHRNRSDECEKSPEAGSPTRSCVYSLPKRNLSLSDAGTYYCAVAMCGEMLFGNGTKLDIDEFHCSSQMMVLICLSIIRAGLLLSSLLIFTLCYGAVKLITGQTKSRTVGNSGTEG